jgi:cell division protein FtsL
MSLDEKKLAKEIVRQTKEAEIPKAYKNPKTVRIMMNILWLGFFTSILISLIMIVDYEIEEYEYEQTITDLTEKVETSNRIYDETWDYVYQTTDLLEVVLGKLDCTELRPLLVDEDFSRVKTTIRDLILSRGC